jgi:hypothetical protein
MKNYFVLFLFVTFTSFGQYKEFKKDVKNTVDIVKTTSVNAGESIKNTTLNTINSADTSRVSKQIYMDVKTVIKSVANALGIAAEKVYTVITKKYLIEGITGLFSHIIFIVIYIFLIKFLFILCRNNQNNEYFLLSSAMVVCVGFGLLMTNLINFTENVGKTFNSEYYTIKFIFDNFKELK